MTLFLFLSSTRSSTEDQSKRFFLGSKLFIICSGKFLSLSFLNAICDWRNVNLSAMVSKFATAYKEISMHPTVFSAGALHIVTPHFSGSTYAAKLEVIDFLANGPSVPRGVEIWHTRCTHFSPRACVGSRNGESSAASFTAETIAAEICSSSVPYVFNSSTAHPTTAMPQPPLALFDKFWLLISRKVFEEMASLNAFCSSNIPHRSFSPFTRASQNVEFRLKSFATFKTLQRQKSFANADAASKVIGSPSSACASLCETTTTESAPFFLEHISKNANPSSRFRRPSKSNGATA